MLAFIYKILLLLPLVAMVTCGNIGSTRQDINLSDDGGYTDLLVTIDESVPENRNILQNLKVPLHILLF